MRYYALTVGWEIMPYDHNVRSCFQHDDFLSPSTYNA